jgi:sporulation protein YlmC with PRC-barrel domain
MKAWFAMTLVATGAWLAVDGISAAAERGVGVREDLDRSGVDVDFAANGQATTRAVRVRDLLGIKVYNPSHENIGKIEDVLMDPSAGKAQYAVLSLGGFLGLGENLFPVPWQDLKLVGKSSRGLAGSAGNVTEDYYVLGVRKDVLKNAPAFDEKNWPDLGNPNWSAGVDKFYKSQRAPTPAGP